MAGQSGHSLRDRSGLLRPTSWARPPLEAALLAAACATLAISFVTQILPGPVSALAVLWVPAILVAAWLGSRRVLAVTVAAAVVLDAVLAARGTMPAATAATRAALALGMGVLTGVAAAGYAGTSNAAARLALVSRVSRISTSSSSLAEILTQVLREMAREGLRGGVIALIDEHHRLFIAAAEGDLDDSVRNLKLRMGEGIMGTVAQTGRSALVGDLDAPGSGAAHRDLGSNARIRSLLCVPLLSAGTVIGVLSVDSSRPDNFSADDLAVLEQIAVAIAGSVQRTGALQLADRMLQQRVDELTLLLDTASRLSESLELDVVLREVVSSTALLVSHGGAGVPSRATFYRLDPDGWARVVAVEDDETRAALPADLPLDEHPLIADAVARGRAVSAPFDDTRFGPRVRAVADRLGLRYGAWSSITTGTAVIGVLAASSRDESGFDPEEMRLLEGIAHLAGLAIGNAQALGLARERAVTLEEHAQRMAQVERVKSEFLRLASHELRGPLAVLGGYLSMVEDGSLPPEQVRTLLPVLVTKTAEMNRLVDQMLETARLEDGKLHLDRETADLVDLLHEAVSAVLPMGAPRHSVVVEAGDAVPVWVDAGRVVTVLANLVGNAVKYSPGGGEVHCSVSVDGDHALVRIADQGIGISGADMPRLFTRFGRVVNRENSHIAGTGLGLYLSRELARMHGGDITVESSPGEGSVFTLRLPAPVPMSEALPA